jgi:hypothetical protein
MKKLLLLIVALITFTLGCFAANLPPPLETKQPCVSFQTETQSFFATNFTEVREKAVQNKLIDDQEVLAATVSTIKETSAESDINQTKTLTGYRTVDLPPNLSEANGFNGNVKNKIRADSKLSA